jgi:hypothetical protein
MDSFKKNIQNQIAREISYAADIEKILANSAGDLHKAGFKVFTLTKATDKQDMQQGFDYVFRMAEITIPVRIRTPKYLRYADITIRSRSRYGGETERDKIQSGFGDIYFYSWEGVDGYIDKWVLIDLNKVRKEKLLNYRDNGMFGKIPRESKCNTDGTEFITIGLNELEISGCIISKSY